MRIIVEPNAGHRKILAQIGVTEKPTIEQIKAIDKDFNKIADEIWSDYEGYEWFDKVYQVALEKACKNHIGVSDVVSGHIVGVLIW